jgi:hypothetical protein
MSPNAASIVASTISVTATPNVTKGPAVPAPTMLSEDEKHFRFELQTFILSRIQEQANSFVSLALTLPQNLNQLSISDNDKRIIENANGLLEPLIRTKYLTSYTILSKSIAVTSIDTLDVTTIVANLHRYMNDYAEAQGYFLDFLRLTRMDPNRNNMLRNWLDTDSKASSAFRDLLALPIAAEHGVNNFGVFASDQLQQYMPHVEPSQSK